MSHHCMSLRKNSGENISVKEPSPMGQGWGEKNKQKG